MYPRSTPADAHPAAARRRPAAGLQPLLAPAAAYLALGLWATWPLARVATGHIVSHFSPEDILLHTWNLTWDVHALAHQPARLFDANIFHPAPDTLALSEHLLGQLPLTAPVWLLTGNPVLAINVDVFLTFVLAGVFTHLLVRR